MAGLRNGRYFLYFFSLACETWYPLPPTILDDVDAIQCVSFANRQGTVTMGR